MFNTAVDFVAKHPWELWLRTEKGNVFQARFSNFGCAANSACIRGLEYFVISPEGKVLDRAACNAEFTKPRSVRTN